MLDIMELIYCKKQLINSKNHLLTSSALKCSYLIKIILLDLSGESWFQGELETRLRDRTVPIPNCA